MIAEKLYRYKPVYAVPPGKTLAETIAALGMDQKELAIRTGLNKKTINQIINFGDVWPNAGHFLFRIERECIGAKERRRYFSPQTPSQSATGRLQVLAD